MDLRINIICTKKKDFDNEKNYCVKDTYVMEAGYFTTQQ